MYTQVVRPHALHPGELDAFLARGWYRIGQTLMTCRVVVFDGVLRSAVWTRIDIDSYTPRRGLRKLLSRSRRRFRIEVGAVTLDDVHEALYQRYRGVARGERSATLVDFLYGDTDRDVFETLEVRIWDGDRLVAFSWFDTGEDSLQSLIGVYEPDLKRHSLGFTTMLVEIEWGKANGKLWFYPGYVLPGESAMDYKLRLGQVEALDSRGEWRPYDDLSFEALPDLRLDRALGAAAEALDRHDLPWAHRAYPMFEAPAYHANLGSCLSHPALLDILPSAQAPTVLALTYDLDRRIYELMRCVRAVAVAERRDERSEPIELLAVVERLGQRANPDAIAADAARLATRLPLGTRRKADVAP